MPTIAWILIGLLTYGVFLVSTLFWFALRHRSTGTIVVVKEGEKTTYSLELDGDVDDILASKNEVLFKVER
jgi:hypothetical protein